MRTFTKVEDWLARRTDLTAFEKLLIAKIQRYKKGCFMGSKTLANSLGTDARHVQRTIAKLIRREWVIVLYETRYRRLLNFSVDKLLEEEPDLFSKYGEKPYSAEHKQSQKCRTKYGESALEVRSTDRTHSMIHDETVIIDNLKGAVVESMREPAGPLTKAEFEQRRQEQKKLLGVDK